MPVVPQRRGLPRCKSSPGHLPGWRLHQLSNGHWSAWVNGNWRMTFLFEQTDAVLVDYQDYH